MRKILIILAFLPLLVYSQKQVGIRFNGGIVAFQGGMVSFTPPPYIPQSEALFGRMALLGEEPADSQKVILNTFISHLVDYSIWDSADVWYKLDGHAEASSLLNITTDANNATTAGASPPVFSLYEGFEGTGNGYMNSNYNPITQATFFKNTALSFGGYFYGLTSFNSPDIGSRDGSNLFGLVANTTDNIRIYYSSGTSSEITSVEFPVTEALLSVDSDGSDLIFYINGNEWQTISNVFGTFPSLDLYLFAYNFNGTPTNESSNNLSDAFFSSHMDSTQHKEMYNAIADYQVEKSGDEFNTSGFLSGISGDSALNVIAIYGDSYSANFLGGDIPAPLDEGDMYRPIRLTVNNIARRVYDSISTNKATHIRLDATEWAKNGTWGTINTNKIFQPTYTNETYHESVIANSYVEIVIPDGQENFAFISHRDEEFDTLTVTLNGGDISSYGNTTVDLDRTKGISSDIGNVYHTELYENLPAGANTIRIAKGNNTDTARVWGGFYWSGSTTIVQNMAHGGTSIFIQFVRHVNADLIENDLDALLYQIPLANELSEATYWGGLKFIDQIFDSIPLVDIQVTSAAPIGTNPGNQENLWANFSNPNETELSIYYRLHCWRNDFRFIDIYNLTKLQVESDGGAVEDGDAGVYTTDGVHPDEDGINLWWNYIKHLF